MHAEVPQYTSDSACRRAEPTEVCDRLFPAPKPPARKPLPLRACTGMLEQSTIMTKQAITYANFDVFEKVDDLAQQSSDVMQDAMACAEIAPKASPDDAAAWNRAMEEWRTQNAIAQSVMKAKAGY